MPKQITTGGVAVLSATAIGLMPLPGVSGMAVASEVTAAELAELVEQQSEMLERQAQQLEALQARLTQLESQTSSGEATETIASSAAGGSVMPEEASMSSSNDQTTVEDRESIEELQSQVALLEAAQSDQSRIDWSDGGPEFISADGTRRLQIGGRLQYDASTTSGSRYDDSSDERNISGSEARRLRLDISGQLSERIGYKLGYDLAGNDASVRDAYISSRFEWGDEDVMLYVGNKYDDRSLDGATSSNNTWFMERNFVSSAVGPDRGSYGLGVKGKIYGDSRDWHTSFAVTNGRLGADTDHSDTTTYMTRAHWNPWHDGTDMVHLGGWGFYEDFDRSDDAVFKNINAADHFNDNVTIRSRKLSDPESSTAYGLELATSLGSFAAAAEYGQRSVDQRDSTGSESMSYDAWSVQASYFLTGEYHAYSRKSGVWRLPEINDPVATGGPGAFQLAARYQELDFNDAPDYPGGNGDATTVGLNWYPNDWSRVMLDYTLWDTNNRSGDFEGPDDGNTLSARVQVVF
ncbi:porin [Halomonas huangheensis]|uniref:Porin n=1 Tax=Halomonas huangheensis TaxID=1178482 RepID=W1N8B5_9GAMM|nr:porin [Halomonas huangheensis]ALM51081.1 hypothetical protein AR456_01305 [Halomonas huangheensis]ERL51165.1 hypothetical protein BJB45_14775 [Halomonas huangheensis]